MPNGMEVERDLWVVVYVHWLSRSDGPARSTNRLIKTMSYKLGTHLILSSTRVTYLLLFSGHTVQAIFG